MNNVAIKPGDLVQLRSAERAETLVVWSNWKDDGCTMEAKFWPPIVGSLSKDDVVIVLELECSSKGLQGVKICGKNLVGWISCRSLTKIF